MRPVVIHFHPLNGSFSCASRDRAVAGLRRATGGDPAVVELTAEPSDQPVPPTDTLVLVYPTWWSGQPAALTHWLHQVRDDLSTVKRLVAVTSHGSPKRINLLQGESGKRLLRKVILPRCAPGATFEWLAFYNVDAAENAQRLAFLDRVESHLSAR
jgi:NAD(P)H dehydrogenase (quinone)